MSNETEEKRPILTLAEAQANLAKVVASITHPMVKKVWTNENAGPNGEVRAAFEICAFSSLGNDFNGVTNVRFDSQYVRYDQPEVWGWEIGCSSNRMSQAEFELHLKALEVAKAIIAGDVSAVTPEEKVLAFREAKYDLSVSERAQRIIDQQAYDKAKHERLVKERAEAKEASGGKRYMVKLAYDKTFYVFDTDNMGGYTKTYRSGVKHFPTHKAAQKLCDSLNNP